MTVEEISAEINQRLKAIEASKANKRKDSEHALFYHAGCYVHLKKVRVVYVSYQGVSALTKPEAGWYLEILRSGFIGSHHSAFQVRGKAMPAVDSVEHFFRMAEGPHRPKFTDLEGVEFLAATRAFYGLVESVSVLVPKSELGSKWNGHGIPAIVPNTDGFYPTGTFPEVRSCRPDIQAALNSLFNEVDAALKKSGKLGEGRGTNLLISLAKGRITADQLKGTTKS